jgi:hypothetical protein
MQPTSEESKSSQSTMPAEQQENNFQFDNDFDFDDASYQWRLNKKYTGKGIFQYKQEAISSSIVTRSHSQSFSSSKENRITICKRKNTASTFASIGSKDYTFTG